MFWIALRPPSKLMFVCRCVSLSFGIHIMYCIRIYPEAICPLFWAGDFWWRSFPIQTEFFCGFQVLWILRYSLYRNYLHFISSYGDFLNWWYPTTMGFPIKNDHFGVFWGYHHFRKPPYQTTRWVRGLPLASAGKMNEKLLPTDLPFQRPQEPTLKKLQRSLQFHQARPRGSMESELDGLIIYRLISW